MRVFLLLLAPSLLAAGEEERQFLHLLEARGLSSLREAECRRFLSTRQSDPELEGEVTIELAATIASRGSLRSSEAERKADWEQADMLVRVFLDRHPRYGRLPLLRYQWGLRLLERAAIRADLAKLVPPDPAAASEARHWLSAAENWFTEIAEQGASEIERRSPRDQVEGHELSYSEMSGLLAAVEFERGKVALARARLEDDPKARAAELERCQQVFGRFAAGARAPVVLDSQLALAEARLLAGNIAGAIAALDRLAELRPEATQQWRADRLRALALLQQGKTEQAIELLNVPNPTERGGEGVLLLIEALLSHSQRLAPAAPGEAAALERQAVHLVDDLESHAGGYWARRGEQLLARFISPESASMDASLAHRLGNVFWAQGKSAEALRAYDQAAALALRAGDRALAARLSARAAEVTLALGKRDEAVRRYEKVSVDYADQPIAADALSTAGAIAAGEISTGSNDRRWTEYERLTRELLSRFSQDPIAVGTGRLRLGELAERRGDPSAAIGHYRAIPPEHPRYSAAVLALAGLYHDQLVSESKNSAGNTEAIQVLSAAHSRLKNASEVADVKTLATLEYVLGRLLMADRARLAEAATMFEAALARVDALSAALRGRAARALLLVNVRAGRTDAARSLLVQYCREHGADMLAAVAELDPEAEGLGEGEKTGRVRVIESASEILFAEPDKLAPAEQRALRLLLGKAYLASGRAPLAERMFKRLAAEDPRDATVLAALGRCYFDSGQNADSLALWSRLERGLARGSAGWIEAVYFIIATRARMGERESARRLLEATRALYPELGNAAWKNRFASLEKNQLAAPTH